MTSDGPILLIGGTRGAGLLIAHQLAQQGLAVRALARDAASAKGRLPPNSEIVRGDLTLPATLPLAIEGARHIIFTAGYASGHPASSRTIRRIEYEGVLNTLTGASQVGFAGRFLYMTASGVGRRSFWSFALNLYKGNTLMWRARAETAIRNSGLPYTIIRAGMLTDGAAGQNEILVTQRSLPLSPRHRIARSDVATVFVEAMQHLRTIRTTFEIVWQRDAPPWRESLDRLEPDPGNG